MPSSPLRVAVVCSSNQNRSMEAHNILRQGFQYPEKAPQKANSSLTLVFSYTQNGILHMLDRNKRIKPRPERFQNCKDLFDLILTCEERVYDQVVEDLNSREQETCQPVHVVNVDIQDNHEEATLGAFLICELCQCIQHTEDMENEIDELLQEFEEKSGRAFLHTVCFY
ncbi:RNA polymerase II subunit A C-terminal domain phosphatase SSU72 [Grammomys surdaster]|uniref:RNA polymerase II subunit A C-terminal domain phosphatase SSU72 n=1 Tax=Grammomys surdaster TaxID=491861 RepID=UPI0010A00A69|nr:RNA polymerase II subunit A C-terminal domain phosphatase SSU72 [Grammomys surdaster]